MYKELESAQPLESYVVESPVASETTPGESLAVESPWYAFIYSTRFWVMIFGSISVYLEAKGLIGPDERNLIATIAAIFVTVKTLDRGAEQMSK